MGEDYDFIEVQDSDILPASPPPRPGPRLKPLVPEEDDWGGVSEAVPVLVPVSAPELEPGPAVAAATTSIIDPAALLANLVASAGDDAHAWGDALLQDVRDICDVILIQRKARAA